jgi:hypothetical protein
MNKLILIILIILILNYLFKNKNEKFSAGVPDPKCMQWYLPMKLFIDANKEQLCKNKNYINDLENGLKFFYKDFKCNNMLLKLEKARELLKYGFKEKKNLFTKITEFYRDGDSIPKFSIEYDSLETIINKTYKDVVERFNELKSQNNINPDELQFYGYHKEKNGYFYSLYHYPVSDPFKYELPKTEINRFVLLINSKILLLRNHYEEVQYNLKKLYKNLDEDELDYITLEYLKRETQARRLTAFDKFKRNRPQNNLYVKYSETGLMKYEFGLGKIKINNKEIDLDLYAKNKMSIIQRYKDIKYFKDELFNIENKRSDLKAYERDD